MLSCRKRKYLNLILLSFVLVSIQASTASAHCDALDGPLISEAEAAIANGDITPLLKWVSANRETELKELFHKSQVVRNTSETSAELADRYFLENLVRIHRDGENEPYTGIKEAGNIPSAIMAADHSIEIESVENLASVIGKKIKAEIQDRFQRLMDKKQEKDSSVEAGREYVEAYVNYIHYIENAHKLLEATASSHHH